MWAKEQRRQSNARIYRRKFPWCLRFDPSLFHAREGVENLRGTATDGSSVGPSYPAVWPCDLKDFGCNGTHALSPRLSRRAVEGYNQWYHLFCTEMIGCRPVITWAFEMVKIAVLALDVFFFSYLS